MTVKGIKINQVVLFASFCSFLLCSGSLQTLGIFISPLMEQFDNGSSAVLGWISSSGFAIMNLAGPFASVFVNKFDARKATVLGGLILSIGMVLSAFAHSSVQLFLFLGIVTGLGASLIFLAIPVNLAEHFAANYCTAVGIAMAGVSTGVIVLPLVSEELISMYGWRGALLIQGGLTLNITVMGMLFKPVSKCTKLTQTRSADLYAVDGEHKFESENNIFKQNRNTELRCVVDDDDQSFERTEMCTITRSTSTCSLEVQHLNKKSKSFEKSTQSDYESKEELGSKETKKSWWQYSNVVVLLSNKPIIMAAYTATYFVTVSYVAAFTHMANQVSLMGYSSRQSAIALSSIGIGGAFARAFHGCLVDRKVLSSTTLYEIAMLFASVGTLLNPVLNTYYGYLISGLIIGLTVGIMYPLFYTILREMVGLEQLSTASGLALFFDGCGAMTGGYLAGFIRDISGSYDTGYYLFAGCFLFASIIFIPIIVLQRRQTLQLQTPDGLITNQTAENRTDIQGAERDQFVHVYRGVVRFPIPQGQNLISSPF